MSVVKISDEATGTSAEILAGFGFNCFRLTIRRSDAPLDVIWSEPDFESGTKRASGSGMPILFPFPGRIAGTQFEWEGKTYSLLEGDGRGNAIHGFVHERPWRVIEQTTNHVVGQFQASVDDPNVLESWPADFRITATYAITATGLRTQYVIENPDSRPLPCGLGTHPYFRVPLGGPSADDCVVKLPVTHQWELDGMLTTGKIAPLEDAKSFHTGLKFGEMSFDNVFGGLLFLGSSCTASIRDPAGQRSLVMMFDGAFRELVVYNPPHREALCIEPYTCVPDPIRLSKENVNAGLRVLGPGESFEANVEIRVL